MTSFLNCVKSIHFKSFDLLRAFSVSTYRLTKLFACKKFPNLSDQADLGSENLPHLAKLCEKLIQRLVQIHESFHGDIGAQP